MPQGKERRHKLVNLKSRMDERGETPFSLSQKTTTVSPGRIIALCQHVDTEAYKALDHETIELANALACFPEYLKGVKTREPMRTHTHDGMRRGRGMSIPEDNWSGV